MCLIRPCANIGRLPYMYNICGGVFFVVVINILHREIIVEDPMYSKCNVINGVLNI